MKKVKIAQIGTSKNSHGTQIWKSLTKQTDLFEVVGYAFPENERERFPNRVAAFDGYREMTVEEILRDPEIEAVAVETEEMYLTKYAQMVASAGKHLHMEKPGGVGFADFKRLVDTLRESNLVFSLGYMYRFNPKIKELIERVDRGELGRIYSVEAHMDCKHQPEVRNWLGNFPGGMMFYLGCHLVDLIYRLQGEPEEIIPLNCSTDIDGVHTDDLGMVVFKYKNGVSFAKTCASEYGGYLRRQLVVCGEHGTVEIRPLEAGSEDSMYTVSSESRSARWPDPPQTDRSDLYNRYDSMLRQFAELVRGGENPYSYDYELKLYELILRSCGGDI